MLKSIFELSAFSSSSHAAQRKSRKVPQRQAEKYERNIAKKLEFTGIHKQMLY